MTTVTETRDSRSVEATAARILLLIAQSSLIPVVLLGGLRGFEDAVVGLGFCLVTALVGIGYAVLATRAPDPRQ